MSRPNRNRLKSTIYLGPEEVAALQIIQKSIHSNRACSIRAAIRRFARDLKGEHEGAFSAVMELVSRVERISLLPDAERKLLQRLCAKVRIYVGK